MAVSEDRNASEGQSLPQPSIRSARLHSPWTFLSQQLRDLVPGAFARFGLRVIHRFSGWGREDVYDAALDNGSNLWQWSVVNAVEEPTDRNRPEPVRSTADSFPLRLAGTNHFPGPQANAGLDEILITNDPDYVPTALYRPTR